MGRGVSKLVSARYMLPKIVGFAVFNIHVIFFARCSDGKMCRLDFIIKRNSFISSKVFIGVNV